MWNLKISCKWTYLWNRGRGTDVENRLTVTRRQGMNGRPGSTYAAMHIHAQLFPILCNPVDCSPPGSSIRDFLQARTLEWVAISSSRGSSQPRDWTHISISWIAEGFFTAELPRKPEWNFPSTKQEKGLLSLQDAILYSGNCPLSAQAWLLVDFRL